MQVFSAWLQNKCPQQGESLGEPGNSELVFQKEERSPLDICVFWGRPGEFPRDAGRWQLTLVQGGMVTFKWQRMCCASSYFIGFRRNDKNPPGSRLLSLT